MKFAKKTDLIILAAVALCAAGIWLFYQQTLAKSPAKAELYLGSELIKTIELRPGFAQSFTVPENPHVVFRQEGGSVWFESSDCPDQVCVRAGRLSSAGQSAACLPNKLILKLVPADGQPSDGPDLVVR